MRARLGPDAVLGTLTFEGTSGQRATVRIANNSVYLVTVKLLKPNGGQLTSTFSASRSFTLPPQTLPATGTYSIVVDPYSTYLGSLNVAVTSP